MSALIGPLKATPLSRTTAPTGQSVSSRTCAMSSTLTSHAYEYLIHVHTAALTHAASGGTYALQPLGEAAEILQAGGIFEYAKLKGML